MIQHLWGAGMILLLAGVTSVAAATPDPLAPHRGRHRILVASAPAPGDATLERQRTVFRAMGKGAGERDVVLLEAVGSTPGARALRAAVGIGESGFSVVLVGKDGGVKLRSTTVLGSDQLFPLIDAMPMRRKEMSRQR